MVGWELEKGATEGEGARGQAVAWGWGGGQAFTSSQPGDLRQVLASLSLRFSSNERKSSLRPACLLG